MAEGRAELEERWRALVGRDLPAVAPARCWPVRLDHCFARILLDAVCDAPWHQKVRPPAYRNLPAPDLARAIRLGEGALAGEVDLARLNERSLALRGKRHPRQSAQGVNPPGGLRRGG